MSGAQVRTSRDEVLSELESAQRFLLVTHENPDGDAIGSLVAMRGVLRELDRAADRVERFLIDRFPDGAVVRRLQASAEDLWGLA